MHQVIMCVLYVIYGSEKTFYVPIKQLNWIELYIETLGYNSIGLNVNFKISQ